MYSHIEDWKACDLSQKTYCRQHSIAVSTFQYWRKKYIKEFTAHSTSELAPGFIPVKVQSDLETDQVHIQSQLHFLFPNGIQVMCPESVDPEVLKTLLNP